MGALCMVPRDRKGLNRAQLGQLGTAVWSMRVYFFLTFCVSADAAAVLAAALDRGSRRTRAAAEAAREEVVSLRPLGIRFSFYFGWLKPRGQNRIDEPAEFCKTVQIPFLPDSPPLARCLLKPPTANGRLQNFQDMLMNSNKTRPVLKALLAGCCPCGINGLAG
jgi:hypothetical protein